MELKLGKKGIENQWREVQWKGVSFEVSVELEDSWVEIP